MSFQKILVAIDNSDLSHAVFATALELAQSNKGVMMLLHCLATEMVTEPTSSMMLDTGLSLGVGNSDYQTQQILIQRQIEEAKAILKRYSEEAKSQGVTAASDYKIGEAGSELCKLASQWGADLIVVGRRGLTGLAEAFLGSVSNYVVHHAPCAVLVIQDIADNSPPDSAVADLYPVEMNPTSNQEES